MADPTTSGAGGKQTLVEDGTSFKGSMTSTCPVVVRGRLEGDLEAPALAISTSGAVQGRAKVGQVQSEGEVAGEIDADTVQLSGVVKDNTVIKAKTLEVKLTAVDQKMEVTFGNSVLSVGAEPVDDGKPGKKKKGGEGPPDQLPPM